MADLKIFVFHKLDHFAKICHNKCQTTFKNTQTTNSKATAKKSSCSWSERQYWRWTTSFHQCSTGPWSSWLSTASIQKVERSKLDLQLKVYKQLIKHTQLQNSRHMVGQWSNLLILVHSHASSPVTFYIVSIAVQPILGLTGCIRLGLVQRVHSFQVPDMYCETLYTCALSMGRWTWWSSWQAQSHSNNFTNLAIFQSYSMQHHPGRC